VTKKVMKLINPSTGLMDEKMNCPDLGDARTILPIKYKGLGAKN
jgi:hypothetical protein